MSISLAKICKDYYDLWGKEYNKWKRRAMPARVVTRTDVRSTDAGRALMSRETPMLQGAIAFVTGGGSGIGHGVALCLAGYGAVVIISDISKEMSEAAAEDVQTAGGRGFAMAHDVSQWDKAAEALAKGGRLAGGPIDVLVNCAGLYFSVPFHELSPAAHERLYAVNVSGVFAMCR